TPPIARARRGMRTHSRRLTDEAQPRTRLLRPFLPQRSSTAPFFRFVYLPDRPSRISRLPRPADWGLLSAAPSPASSACRIRAIRVPLWDENRRLLAAKSP